MLLILASLLGTALITFLIFLFQPLVGIVLALIVVCGLVALKYPFLGTLGYLFTVGFVALFNFPITNDGLKLSTVILMGTFLTYIVLYLWSHDWTPLKLIVSRPEHLIVLLFFIAVIVSVKNTEDLGQAIKGVKQFSYCVFAYFLAIFSIRSKKQLDWAVWIVVISGVIIGLCGVREMVSENLYKTLNYTSIFGAKLSYSLEKYSQNRINGLVADGDLHGAYMATVFMFSFFLFFKVKPFWQKGFLIFAMVLAFFNIFGAAARGAVLGFTIMITVWWCVWDGKQKVLKAALVGIGAILFISVMVMSTDLEIDRVYSSPEGVSSRTIDLRLTLWEMGSIMFQDKPILGHGPNGFDIEYFPTVYKASSLARKSTRFDVMNVYVEVAVSYGLVGIVIYGSFILFILYRQIILVRFLRGPYRSLAFSLLAMWCGYSVFVCTSGHLVDLIYWEIPMFTVVLDMLFEKEIAAARAARKGEPAPMIPAPTA